MGVKKAGGADDDSGSLQCLMGKGGRAQLSGRSLKITSLEDNPPRSGDVERGLAKRILYLHILALLKFSFTATKFRTNVKLSHVFKCSQEKPLCGAHPL